jgi:hypothetical protein
VGWNLLRRNTIIRSPARHFERSHLPVRPTPHRPLILLFLILLSFLAFPAAARADSVSGEVLSVGLGGIHGRQGHYRTATWVPVLVRLTNISGQNLNCTLRGTPQSDMDGDHVISVSRPFVLKAGDQDRDLWFYYWPRADDAGNSPLTSVTVADDAGQTLATLPIPAPTSTEQPGIPQIDDADGEQNRLVLLLGGLPAGFGAYDKAQGGNAILRFAGVDNAAGLPDDPLGYAGIDAIIWQTEQLSPADLTDPQMQALLTWVRSGGHLIISAGKNFHELTDPRHGLAPLLPLDLTGLQELPDTSILRFPYADIRLEEFITNKDAPDTVITTFAPVTGRFTQLLGTLRPGATAIPNHSVTAPAGFVDAPLVTTQVAGAGTVTLISLDMSAGNVTATMSADNWLAFWDAVGCWGRGTVSGDRVDKYRKANLPISDVRALALDADVASSVDLTRQTALRLLLAMAFLAAYWVAAGPGGYGVLRWYHRTQLGWWIFGATVLAASGVAVLAVTVLKMENVEIKHTTFVRGTDGSPDAAVLAYYGLFSPAEHHLPLSLGKSPTATLAPFTQYVTDVQSFADPQTYETSNATPGTLAVPFRSTLKKLQGSALTTLPGIDAQLSINPDALTTTPDRPLKGTLTNRTGVTLNHVWLVGWIGRSAAHQGRVFSVAETWHAGDSVAVDSLVPLSDPANTVHSSMSLESLLAALGTNVVFGKSTFGPSGDLTPDERSRAATIGDLDQQRAFLSVLGDLRSEEPINGSAARIAMTRALLPGVDRSAAFRAAKVLLIATATGPAPLPLEVDSQSLGGTGKILYSWTLVPRPPSAETKP